MGGACEYVILNSQAGAPSTQFTGQLGQLGGVYLSIREGSHCRFRSRP